MSFGGLTAKQLEGFCRRFATGMQAGVDLPRLLAMESKYGGARHRQVIEAVAKEVHKGGSLADGMKGSEGYFPQLLVRMIGAGEHSGRVDHVFATMADHYEEVRKAQGAFLGQITFPLISLAIAFLTISLLIFVNGFMQAGSALDQPFDLTGIGLRGFSGLILFWSFCALFAGAMGFVAYAIWKNWFGSHRVLFPLVRNLPVVGPVVTNTALARLSMTLSMMLGAGVDAKRSARESIFSTGNQFYIDGIKQVEEEIQKGNSFADSFRSANVFPEEFLQIVEVGELSGSESESLERLASTYRDKGNRALQQLAVVAGVVVWLMIAAIIIAAIFTIFGQIMQVYSNALKM